jgi:MazG family protein
MAEPSVADTFTRLVDIMARLRAPGGCPWDREQTPETLRPYLLEEAYEVLDAIDGGEPTAVRDELGDLLLQVVFHAQLAAEAGRFTIADVARAIAAKLVRRHPHVFGEVQVRDAQEVVRNWSRIKADERREKGNGDDVFAGVPVALPALLRSQRLGEKGRHLGLDWDNAAGVLTKVHEEQAELESAIAAGDRAGIEHELGDLLFALTSLARHLDISAELALREAGSRFVARARRLDAMARARDTTLAALPAEERERLWQEAKAAESTSRAARV